MKITKRPAWRHLLLTAPLANGLFHKAISGSGGGRDGLCPTRLLKGCM